MNAPMLCMIFAAALPWLLCAGVAAQEPDAGPAVTLNFPEGVPIKTLADYVSQRLNINILYDEQVGAKKITIKASAPIPAETLLGVLESALKMNGLALADADQPGWKRIVPVQNLTAISLPPGVEPGDARLSTAVTRVFNLHHAQAQQADTVIKPFLTQPGGNSMVVPGHEMLIVTDFAPNVVRVEKLIDTIDRPGREMAFQFVKVQQLEAQQLAQQLTQLLAAKSKAQAGQGQPGVEVLHDARTNQLILIGAPDRVADAVELVNALDTPLGLETKVYSFETASPERVDSLIRELIGELSAKRLYKSAIDAEANLLIVTTTPDVHQQLSVLRTDLDKPTKEQQSPIRFYKLENASAQDVLATIAALEGGYGLESVEVEGLSVLDRSGSLPVQPQGANAPPSPPGQPPATPPTVQESRERERLREAMSGARSIRGTSRYDSRRSRGSRGAGAPGITSGVYPAGVETESARVTADLNTNTIIVIAEPSIQRVYEQLIKKLDQRRPQVLIEATIVTLDTSNGFSLGVEISRTTDIGDDERVLNFSSFGLSEVDPDTGRLTLTPGLGFNGAVISADIADIVIRALKTTARAKVLSAPRILVNDNATGTINSLSEVPFISINASDTVATTSFADFADAGTTLTVTPQISQGDHLKLQYSVELSSFSGEGTEVAPPPRQTNTVESEVTVPDGHTIVIGGLKRQDFRETIQRIPILGEIPILEFLASSRTINDSESSLFVFIRPVILRDDQFNDLKFFSRRDADRAGITADYPASEPLTVH